MNHHTMTTAFIEMIQEYVDKESTTIEERKNRVADLSNYEKKTQKDEIVELANRITELENKIKG
jgi:polyhydroxyalkanoate synthesis regulator phasin